LSGNLGDHGEVSSNVNAVIALYPPTDFLSMPKNFDGLIDYYSSDSPVAKLLGEPLSTAKDKAKLASPLQHVTNKCPPMLLLHGDKDPIVPVEQSKILHAALCNVGVDCQLHILSGYTHGDYRFNLGPGEKHIDDFLESYK